MPEIVDNCRSIGEAIEAANQRMGAQGLRVLAFAARIIDPGEMPALDRDPMSLTTGLSFVGMVGMIVVGKPTNLDKLSFAGMARRAHDRLAALAALHRDGITHGDLKPSNVMLTPSGAKVFDFGIAAIAGAERTIGAVVAWGASMVEPGLYDRTSAGGFVVGRSDGSVDARLDELARILDETIGELDNPELDAEQRADEARDSEPAPEPPPRPPRPSWSAGATSSSPTSPPATAPAPPTRSAGPRSTASSCRTPSRLRSRTTTRR